MNTQLNRQWDWMLAILYLSVILTAVSRLTITNWLPDLNIVRALAWQSALLGMLLGYSRFKRRTVVFLAIGYSLITLTSALSSIIGTDVELQERLLSLGGRLLFAISEYVQFRPIKDHIFLISQLSIIYWSIGLIGGYMLVRHANLLIALLPPSLASLTIHNFDAAFPNRIWLLGLYLLFSFALIGRQYYIASCHLWNKQQISISPEASTDFTGGILFSITLIIIVAWSLPIFNANIPIVSTAWEKIVDPWINNQDRAGDAFAAIDSMKESTEFFGNQLSLGTSVPLSNNLVFVVYAPENATQFPRFYWRGRVYNEFKDNQWGVSQNATRTHVTSTDAIQIKEEAGSSTESTSFTFKVYNYRQSLLFAAAQPVWASRKADLLVVQNPDHHQDVFALFAVPLLEPGEIYHTRSTIINPTISDLRDAGQDYPEWIEEQYIQLPEDISPRLVELAKELTNGIDNPYEKVQFITNYLRETIEYDTNITLPPEQTDILEYILFDLKKGFCNYYATLEVLMLRSIGIPARMAVGFAQGEYNQTDNTYLVRRIDSHAWPEVYFPDIGWVEFEPTTYQPPIIRPVTREIEPTPPAELTGPNATPTPENDDETAPVSDESASSFQSLNFVLGGLVLLIVVVAAWSFNKIALSLGLYSLSLNIRFLNRKGRKAPLDPISRAYQIIPRGLRFLGRPLSQTNTPAELTLQLSTLIPGAELSINALLDEYQKSLYSPKPGNILVAKQANRLILRAVLQTRGKYLIKSIRNYFSISQ